MAYPNSKTNFVIKIDKNASGYAVGPEYFNVPGSSPYELYLDHVPKDSSTTTIGASGGASWTEVLTTPTSADHYMVSYDTGKVTFHSGNANDAAQASYQSLGDDVMAEHINIIQDEITSIETELGDLPSSSFSSVSDRLNSIQSQVDSISAGASGFNGQNIIDNTVRAGALMDDIKGAGWVAAGRPTLQNITNHEGTSSGAHAATAISVVGPGATTFVNVSQHVRSVGSGTATDTNPHGITAADLAIVDLDLRPVGNLSANVVYGYNALFGGVAASGNIVPSASGAGHVGVPGTKWLSGNFNTITANSVYGTTTNASDVNVGESLTVGVEVVPEASGFSSVGTKTKTFSTGYYDAINIKTASFDREYDNGNSGSTKTINWNNGNKQRVTLTEAPCTFTFTDPAGACNVMLVTVQGSGGSKTATWPTGKVKWPAATAPTLSTTAGYIDIITFYFDGTYYYGVGSVDFR